MKKNYVLFGIIGLVLVSALSYFIIAGLNSKSKPVNTAPKVEQPKSEQYISIFNNTNVRKGPGVKFEVSGKLNIGDKVEILGKTDNKEKILSYEDYWYNIKFGDKTGWIFGEYISKLDEADKNIPRRYEQYLKGLSDKNVGSISLATRAFSDYMNISKDKTVHDEMFRKLKSLYDKTAANTTVSSEDVKELTKESSSAYEYQYFINPDKINNIKLRDKLSLFKRNGLRVKISEGTYSVVEDEGYIAVNFAQHLTDGLKDYLNLRNEDLKKSLSEDAALLITWDELSDRLVAYENYSNKYPKYNEANEAKNRLSNLIGIYVSGMENTPAFSYHGDKKLNDKLQASYERFIEKYPNSKYHPIVKGYYEILKKNNFIFNDEAKTFLQQHGIRNPFM